MAEITTSIITDLRARTNAGMMDCKRALTETNGNMEEAIKILRLKGLAIQVKRADKEANQGIVQAAVKADSSAMALVEVNSETDFVAKTDNFKAFVNAVAAKVLAGDEDVAGSMKDDLVAIVSTTGENVRIRRTARFVRTGNAVIESYIHMGGKVGVLVELDCGKAASAANPAVATLAHDIALQVAAAAPRWLDQTQVPNEILESEKALYRKDPKLEGKPEKIVEGALIGKVRKFYSDVCLVNQVYVKDDKQTVSQVVEAAAKAMGDTIIIRRFARFQLGAA
jgi:elongation factor Ts